MWILRGSDDAGPPSSARPVRGPGTIRDWATGRGHDLAGTHLYDGESLPNLDTFDWLVVMGGPMSVHDTDEYSWLAVEKDLIGRQLTTTRSSPRETPSTAERSERWLRRGSRSIASRSNPSPVASSSSITAV